MARIDYNLTEGTGDVVNDTQKIVTSTWTNNVNDLKLSSSFTSSTNTIFGSPTSSICGSIRP